MVNDNVILFKKNNFKFIVTKVWIDFIIFDDQSIEKKHIAVISLKEETSGRYIIHPITEFILENWGNYKFNTQKKHAFNVVKFLNYIITNSKKFNVSSLTELTIAHGENYLNSLVSSKRRRETVIDSENTLTSLYLWFSNIKEFKNIEIIHFTKRQNHLGKEYHESPFKNVFYPSKTNSNTEHFFPLSYIPLFLEVAILVSKPIVLGIYFQLFGGLRVSEVINLSRTQVSRRIHNGEYLLNLQNRNFRTDIKGDASVKKVRFQRVFQIKDWSNILFKEHTILYKPTDGTTALFVNRDGRAISENSYRQYFNKAKNTFIKLLESYGDYEQKALAEHLKKVRWSTHIGRGIFTNTIAEHSNNPLEIAFLRGDRNLTSSLTYMVKTDRIRQKLEEKFSSMYTEYIPRLIKGHESR